MIYTLLPIPPLLVISLLSGLTVQITEMTREDKKGKANMRVQQTKSKGQAAAPGKSGNNGYHKVKCHVPETGELKTEEGWLKTLSKEEGNRIIRLVINK